MLKTICDRLQEKKYDKTYSFSLQNFHNLKCYISIEILNSLVKNKRQKSLLNSKPNISKINQKRVNKVFKK